MAYLSFEFAPISCATAARLDQYTESAFTSREWIVIHMARQDRLVSAKPRSRLARLASVVFGLRITNPLADPRLEALRHAAANLWHGHDIVDPLLSERLRMQGFSLCQLALLSSWIGVQR